MYVNHLPLAASCAARLFRSASISESWLDEDEAALDCEALGFGLDSCGTFSTGTPAVCLALADLACADGL